MPTSLKLKCLLPPDVRAATSTQRLGTVKWIERCPKVRETGARDARETGTNWLQAVVEGLCVLSHIPRRGGLDLIPILQIRKLRQRGCPTPLCSGPKVAHTSYISRLDSDFSLESLPHSQLLSDP